MQDNSQISKSLKHFRDHPAPVSFIQGSLAQLGDKVSISSTFYACFFANVLGPKNFKPKTQLCNFWHQNFAQKITRVNY